MESLSWILIASRVLQRRIQWNKVRLYSQWCRSCALPPSAVKPVCTDTFRHVDFLCHLGKNGTFSKLGCCCWYTSAVCALRKTIREDLRPLLWQTTFSSVDPRILKIFCRPFTPDNQVIIFSVSDYMFIRGDIFAVTGNGTFYYIIMGPKVHCKSLFYRYKIWCSHNLLSYFNKTFLSINPVKVKVNQSLYRPWGLQLVETPRFSDSRHMKVVRLSALRTGRLHPAGNIPGTHMC